MCYSKEVQLITALTIFILSIGFYIYYHVKSKDKPKNHKKWFLPFLNMVIIGFMLIGGHQLFEFLSLLTENQTVYKIGLLLSISSMYFFLKSLEILTNKNLFSKYVFVIIGMIAIHMFFVPMKFINSSFHLEHQSAFLWAFSWLVLFFYWNFCAIYLYKKTTKNNFKKTIIFYLLATLDISFLLSIIYSIFAYFKFSTNLCYSAPSIWCTFFVIQTMFIPFFLASLNKSKIPFVKKSNMNKKKAIMILLTALILVIVLAFLLPAFDCFTWKFVFP
jgi:hypothetical protein